MKYVLMFVETAEFAKQYEAMSPAELEREYQRVDDWFAEYADKITLSSGRLQPAHTATTVRLDAPEPITTDGPFIEGKEVISGFTEIDDADLDEALRMAKTWPACPIVEIRPVLP